METKYSESFHCVCVYRHTHWKLCDFRNLRIKDIFRDLKTKSVSWCEQPVNIPGVAWKNYEKETAFQIYCADWLRKQWEVTGLEKFRRWHHSANERSNAREGFLAKLMGQGKGWPDFVQCGLMCAVEFKVSENDTSADQDGWLEYFKSIGWHSEVIYTYERFVELVEDYE